MSEDQSGGPHLGPCDDGFGQEPDQPVFAARLPEDVSKGLFANTTLIVQLNDAFAIDFISTIFQAPQLVCRVVMPPSTFAQFIAALKTNIAMYEGHFGRLTPRELWQPSPGASGPSPADSGKPAGDPQHASEAAPGANAPPPPRIEELYDQLKFSDKVMGGCFASAVLIRHMSEEFCFEFIANFYPRSVVTSRIIMPAGRVPPFLGAMDNAWHVFRSKFGLPPGAPPQ